METLNHEKLIDQLIKVVRMKQANDDAEFIHLFNEVINGKISKIDKQNPKASVGTNFFNLSVPRKLINKTVLPLPYDGGTGMHANKATLITGGEANCYRDVSRMHLDNAEISLAAVNGQVLNIGYLNSQVQTSPPTYQHGDAGIMYKTVTLRRAYPDEVKVKVITSAQIPNTREAVYFMEPGTLNLSSLGVEGFLINYAGFYNLFGKLTSVISRKTFFQSIKSHGVTQIDMYEKRIIDNDLFLTLSPGTKGFVVGTLAVVKTICSKDLSSLALFNEGNYGYAFVDLRSELDANKPILTRPFTNEFKAPPGGIRLSVALEIYKTN